MVLNPRREPAELTLDGLTATPTPLLASGVRVEGRSLHADGFGYAVLTLG